MKKLKMIRRVFSTILTGLVGLNAIGFTAVAENTDPSYFTTQNENIIGYTGTDVNITLPLEINEVQITGILGSAFKNNTTIESIIIPEGYTYIGASNFRGCSSLKSVSLPSTMAGGNNIVLGNYQFRDCVSLEFVNIPEKITNISMFAFTGCTNPNLVIDIQSLGVTTISSSAFTGVIGTIKTYSQTVYDLVKANAPTANVLLIKDNTTALKDSLSKAAAYKEDNYTIDSYKVLTDAVTAGNTLIENGNASQSEIDNAIEAINNAINGLVKREFIEFDKIMAEAEDILNNHSYEYTSKTIGFLRGDVNRAKAFKESVTGEISEYVQSQINTHTSYMRSSINLLVPLDKTEVFNELQQTITTAESYGSEDFTEESYAELAKALESAKALTEASSFEDLALAKQAIDTALENLKIKPGIEEEAGEPIAIIQKNAVETTLGEFTADEAVAGATKIKITFDCAPDVSFNQYASIEMKANIAGTESYMKFVGTDTTETAGAKGFTIELPLSNAINSGDDVKLVAYTWAWANASDYVYAVTKVEYINAVGQVVKAVTDRTIALDELKTAIAEAEKIESANYTEESFAKLTDALTAAKELPDEAEKADIEVVKTALETAVAGLVEKTDDSSSEPTPDSESEPDSKPDSESSSDTDADSSSKTDSKTDNSSSKTDESNSSTTKTDSASSNSNANTTSNANSGANGSSNPNTGAASATAAGIILLSAIGVIASRKK